MFLLFLPPSDIQSYYSAFSRKFYSSSSYFSLSEEARQKAEEHKSAGLKVEVGVRLALEAIQRAEEEHAWLEDEEEACLIEEARLKAEEEEQAY